MTGIPWIKLEPSILDDVRFAGLEAQQWGTWAQLLALAGRLATYGLFIREDDQPMTVEQIAFLIHRSSKELAHDLSRLKNAGIISQNGHGVQLLGFDELQLTYEKERNNGNERQRKFRERIRERLGISVTPVSPVGDASLTSPESDSDRDSRLSDKETEGFEAEGSSPVKESAPADPSMTDDDEPDFDKAMISKNIGPLQREVGHQAYQIFGAAGLGNPKLEKTCIELAIRIDGEKMIPTLLASLASVYANKRALNKPIVAAHQVLNNSVPVEYFDCEKWADLPEPILQAAGISDIQAHIRKDKAKRAGFA
jgi:hypothetical protein